MTSYRQLTRCAGFLVGEQPVERQERQAVLVAEQRGERVAKQLPRQARDRVPEVARPDAPGLVALGQPGRGPSRPAAACLPATGPNTRVLRRPTSLFLLAVTLALGPVAALRGSYPVTTHIFG